MDLKKKERKENKNISLKPQADMPTIPALRRPRWEDTVSLSYTASLRLAWVTLWDPLSNKTKAGHGGTPYNPSTYLPGRQRKKDPEFRDTFSYSLNQGQSFKQGGLHEPLSQNKKNHKDCTITKTCVWFPRTYKKEQIKKEPGIKTKKKLEAERE